MCSPEVMYNAYKSVEYLLNNNIQGDILELGTWKGGVSAVMAELLANSDSSKRLYVYDTFSGHPAPLPDEVDIWGNSMLERYNQEISKFGTWAAASKSEVESYLTSIYDHTEVIQCEVGPETSFENISKISCLRLDMDWYDPTKAALDKLYHMLSTNSIIIIDDYGHHSGAKKAVDEFFAGKLRPFFMNINYSCIAAVIN
tara:strand:+ start:1439 stop:2038 length:600 start_codon:yes stop_codon:yes gene_type:complete